MPKYSKDAIAGKISRIIPKVTNRKITFWADQELVKPSDPDVIAGRAREWDDQCLIEFGMVAVLSETKATLETIKIIMDSLRDSHQGFLRGSDPEILELVYIEWKSATGGIKRSFNRVTKEKDFIQLMGKNPANPKIAAQVIWLGEVRAMAEKMAKGA
jgi:hypothetical protein